MVRLPRIKTDFAGRAVFTGNEVFVWPENVLYKDVLFQLISGMKQSLIPGYHPTPGWLTVCPVNEDKPCRFIAVESKKLRLLDKLERLSRGIK